ncbi:MAG: hypothetical protein KGN35_07035 [Betaproteobacteria bacterium]|nr:hypothetical protein [Betaproteobacteria bacterium]
MISTPFALVAITLLCLMFKSTRFFGLVGLVSLFQLYPLHFTALLILAGVAYYFIQRN